MDDFNNEVIEETVGTVIEGVSPKTAAIVGVAGVVTGVIAAKVAKPMARKIKSLRTKKLEKQKETEVISGDVVETDAEE